ncbi:uncharacterized protein COLE_05046 [Cutaneotrichosporon oleaginosum]|nr:hypothetical protein COLE_05046 [Cutaneotrichosporon oleaginosum]
MQWTPAAPGRTSTSDLVLSRVLEHYNITHPLRSSIQFRTFRASFPDGDGSATRILTTVTYSQPIPPVRDVPVPTGARDDCTYLFLEDRGVKTESKGGAGATTGSSAKAEEKETKDGDVEMKDEEFEVKKEDKKEPEPIEIKDVLEEDGFEIIDAPKNGAPAPPDPTPSAPPVSAPAPSAPRLPSPPRERKRFKTLAVKPATSVMPTLHNLLSPFVLGLTKQGRAGASTTGQAAGPSPLQGSSLVISTLAFPPPSHPQPPLTLSVHILPNAAPSIFLEAEWEGVAPSAANRAVLEEFLRGCIPDNVEGVEKVLVWDGEAVEGWTGIERTRRMTTVLCRALRESNII